MHVEGWRLVRDTAAFASGTTQNLGACSVARVRVPFMHESSRSSSGSAGQSSGDCGVDPFEAVGEVSPHGLRCGLGVSGPDGFGDGAMLHPCVLTDPSVWIEREPAHSHQRGPDVVDTRACCLRTNGRRAGRGRPRNRDPRGGYHPNDTAPGRNKSSRAQTRTCHTTPAATGAPRPTTLTRA